jgi:hypothetical protein
MKIVQLKNCYKTGLDRAMLSGSQGFSAYQPIASIEFYLRPLAQTEIASATVRSQNMALNPDCTSG